MADTPGTASSGAHEPSMEDILASIRRMIADDDVPAVNAADTSAPVSDDIVRSSAPLEPTALVQAVEPAPEPLAPPSAPTPVDMDKDLVFENFEADFDSEEDLAIPDIALSDDTMVSAEADDGDLIDIDELIAEVESRTEGEVSGTIDEAAVLDSPAAVSDNTDIDLVKSLMADLTEDAPSDEVSDTELDQILGEIADIDTDDSLAVEIDTSGVDDEFNALLKIAQDANADAGDFKLGTGTAVATAVAAAVAATVVVQDEAPEPEIAESVDAQDTEVYIEETSEMADPVETIIQGEVEEATQSAFASLASVVEKKDDVVTSGPAIGDLVKEALQPMLKEWLDKNLKGIVERSVAKEIKRISNTK